MLKTLRSIQDRIAPNPVERRIIQAEKEVAKCPDNAAALFELGQAYLGGNRHEEASNALDRISSDSPVYLEAFYNAAIADWACGKSGAAIDRLQKHIAKSDNDLAHFALGIMYSQLWYLDLAESELTLVLNRGASYLINGVLALLRWRQNRSDEACAELEEANSGSDRESRFGSQFRLPIDPALENVAWFIEIAYRAQQIAKSNLPLDTRFPDSTPNERSKLFAVIDLKPADRICRFEVQDDAWFIETSFLLEPKDAPTHVAELSGRYWYTPSQQTIKDQQHALRIIVEGRPPYWCAWNDCTDSA